MKLFLRVMPGASKHLIGADEESQKYLNRRHPGDVLTVNVRIARNYENHKRFFDFINTTFSMQEHFEEPEAYRKWLIMKAGYFDTLVEPDGAVRLIPRSISFENMDEDEFEKLFSTAIDVFLKTFTHISHDDLMQVISYG